MLQKDIRAKLEDMERIQKEHRRAGNRDFTAPLIHRNNYFLTTQKPTQWSSSFWILFILQIKKFTFINRRAGNERFYGALLLHRNNYFLNTQSQLKLNGVHHFGFY